jgi:hypothetical protein
MDFLICVVLAAVFVVLAAIFHKTPNLKKEKEKQKCSGGVRETYKI